MSKRLILLICCLTAAVSLGGFNIGFAADQEFSPMHNDYYKDSATYKKTWSFQAKDGDHINIYLENLSDSETTVHAKLYLPDSNGLYMEADLPPGQHQLWIIGNKKGAQGVSEMVVTEPDGRQMYVHLNVRQYAKLIRNP